MGIEGLRIRIEPGTHGHAFVVREASSDRCLRRALACVAASCMGHADSIHGKPQMLLAMFRDVRHVESVVDGKEPIELSGIAVPEAVLDEHLLRQHCVVPDGRIFEGLGRSPGRLLLHRSGEVSFVLTHMYDVYLIKDSHRTYIGYTSDVSRRLRQHNREIKGGARATRGGTWSLVCWVRGFETIGSAMSYEWHWKHSARGIHRRLEYARGHPGFTQPTQAAGEGSLAQGVGGGADDTAREGQVAHCSAERDHDVQDAALSPHPPGLICRRRGQALCLRTAPAVPQIGHEGGQQGQDHTPDREGCLDS